MFPILQLPDEADFPEQMGTKFKFWYQDPTLGRVLFKEGRPGTGENWAEKLACELALMLGIPHAHYDLAEWRGKLGVCSHSFIPQGGRLIHGNELLGGKLTEAGDRKFYYAQRSHTISAVLGLLKIQDMVEPPEHFAPMGAIVQAVDVFVGYLLFDAWIGNQDRHSENWGFVRLNTNFYLAPSYYHGSSMARNLGDDERAKRLVTRDQGYSIEHYVTTARSSLYPHGIQGKTRSLLTIEAFEHAWRNRPQAGQEWLDKLRNVSDQNTRDAVNMVPDNIMTPVAKDFTARLLKSNRDRLLSLTI